MLHFIIYLLVALTPLTDSNSYENPRGDDNGRDDTEIIIKDDMGG